MKGQIAILAGLVALAGLAIAACAKLAKDRKTLEGDFCECDDCREEVAVEPVQTPAEEPVQAPVVEEASPEPSAEELPVEELPTEEQPKEEPK